MSWDDYKGKTVGFAKVMGELPVSDGSLAQRIYNFTATEEGFLEAKLANMPLIPRNWIIDTGSDSETVAIYRGPSDPAPEFNTVYAMKYMEMHGESPELLILSSSGVYRFSPSFRHSVYHSPLGSSEYYEGYSESTAPTPGLAEQFLFSSSLVVDKDKYNFFSFAKKALETDLVYKRSLKRVVPQSEPNFPAQMESVNNRIYFTYCDGGPAYVWDGERIRSFGYQTTPSSPNAIGPSSNKDFGDGGWNNGGGFSDGGRIGTLNYNLTNAESDTVVTCGGIESGLWHYAVVFENQDGSYSRTSERSPRVTIQYHVTTPESEKTKWGLGFLRRRFWVNQIPKGPQGTVARILLRTSNLTSLPSGDTGELRFLHRIPNNSALEYMDDIPDSELGSVWEHRRAVPPGFYFMKFFGGSMFVGRTEDYPSRVWWSEQGTVDGSIPESFKVNSWRDIFPETGPITGMYSTTIDNRQILIIFKEKAAHYISSSYEQPGTSGWTFGTLSTVAGCAGPELCQATPDGYIIWYGNGTFWMWGKDTNGVIDIGAPIRKTLSEINDDRERFGVSWITKKNKEVVFCLPTSPANSRFFQPEPPSTREESSFATYSSVNEVKPNKVPNMQFVWDYRNRGWRLREDLTPSAVETFKDFTLIANSTKDKNHIATILKDPDGSASVSRGNIMVYQRGQPGFARIGTSFTYEYLSGWQSFAEFGPDFHSTHRTADSVFTLQERSCRFAKVLYYSDWNYDVPVSSTPEDYAINPSVAIVDGSPALVDETTSGALDKRTLSRYKPSQGMFYKFDLNPVIEKLSLSHPEYRNEIAFWSGYTDRTFWLDSGAAAYGGVGLSWTDSIYPHDWALYNQGTHKWRTRRTYTHRMPVDIPSATVFSFQVFGTTTSDYISLISIDAYGPQSSNPTSRSPSLGSRDPNILGGI